MLEYKNNFKVIFKKKPTVWRHIGGIKNEKFKMKNDDAVRYRDSLSKARALFGAEFEMN